MAKALASVRQSPVAAALRFRTRLAALLLAAQAFFVAWASPLFAPTSISNFSLFCRLSSLRSICFSRFLVSASGCGVASFSGLAISSDAEWTRRVFRFLRLDPAVFLHRPAREGGSRPMRHKQAQLRAKSESATLRWSVTEHAMRSTLNAVGVNAYSIYL